MDLTFPCYLFRHTQKQRLTDGCEFHIYNAIQNFTFCIACSHAVRSENKHSLCNYFYLLDQEKEDETLFLE